MQERPETTTLTVLSVGHSSHKWSTFIDLLDRASVNAIVDVRSSPYSRFQHFSRPNLRIRLNEVGIPYIHLGAQLGGRPTDPAMTYNEMAATPAFLDGIEQVLTIATRTRLALLCSEADVLTCHRLLLVGRHLARRGVNLLHIHRDGYVEPHRETEDRLVALTRHDQPALFDDRERRLSASYWAQEQRIRGKAKRGDATGRTR